MSKTPRIRDQSRAIHVDMNFSRQIWNMDIEALLFSLPHYRKRDGSWSGGNEFYQVGFQSNHDTLHLNWLHNNTLWTGAAAGCSSLLPLPPLHGVSSVRPSLSTVMNSFSSLSDWREAARVPFSEGWNRTMPGAPGASLLQFVAELRDFPVMYGWGAIKSQFKATGRWSKNVKKYRSSFLKGWLSGPIGMIPYKLKWQLGFFSSLGSEYLNHVFGWVPFVKDLEKLFILSQIIDNRLRQIAYQNGKGVRRKVTLENSVTSSSDQKTATTPFYGALAAPPNWTPLGGGSCWRTNSYTRTKIWYSARYRYYIPDLSAGTWIPKARAALQGAIPSPSVMWELLPWSWLVDWFGNVGTVLSNLAPSAVENLVADYAFCMIHSQQLVSASTIGSWLGVHTTGTFNNEIASGAHSLSSIYRVETKVRVKGTPYGLGIKWNSLSGRQLGILAALGISQSSF